jgi:hypothetical protein
MVFQKFLQALLSIIGKPTRIIQLFAVQFRMTAGGSERLKLLPAPCAIFAHEKVHAHQYAEKRLCS